MTGVQTCALPISGRDGGADFEARGDGEGFQAEVFGAREGGSGGEGEDETDDEALGARDRFVAEEFANRVWGLPLYYAAQVALAWSVHAEKVLAM